VDVRPGYKLTAAGVIPVDWAVQSLEESTDPLRPISYGIVQTGPDLSNGVACLRVVDINDGRINKTGLIRTSKQISDAYRRTVLKTGDLVMPLRGKVGDVGAVDEELDGANLTRGVALLAIRPSLSGEYCRHFISWSATRRRLEQSMNGSALQEIAIATLRSFQVAVPESSSEQRAIAAALSDVDALLGGLDQLIAKKRDLKQAAMQQLLTGQSRLPGFSDEWQEKRLGELAEIISGGTPKTSEPAYWGGGIKWCTPTDITGCPGKYLIDTERSISQLGLNSSGARLLPAGALLLCSRATIGELKIASGQVCTNQGFKSLICHPGVSNEYLYYKLATMKAQMVERAFGSTFLEISKANVAALEISTPALSEQSAIAAVLSDMDAELSALEARRDKTRALKQAMMQALLTGKIRLV
jgi:type I restriction enzyme, S subunit